MRLKVASRKSDLARWQAVQVARALEATAAKPSIEFLFKSSLGDQNLDIPLAGMGSKGVFTADFHDDLINGLCDLVVHSWKDLPVEERADTRIALTLQRADVRDVLIVPEVVWQKTRQTRRLEVLTSSPRRVYNLDACLSSLLPGQPKIEFINVRGNVPTRLKKMHAEGRALVLAKAGLDRLLEAEREGFVASDTGISKLLAGTRFLVLPISLNPPAPAQGALAVEVALQNEALLELCNGLMDEKAFACVQREREKLKRHGGGCHQKIGVAVLPSEYGTIYAERGVTDQGEVLSEWRLENSTPWMRASEQTQIFPLDAKQNSWFRRTPISVSSELLSSKEALFIAREDALPSGYVPSERQVIWAAGRQTWVKLAARGVWVHGCQDGLGEQQSYALEQLVGRSLAWTKLTHAQQASTPEELATYKLEPKEDSPDLRGKTHFFWLSGTSFERARQLFPKEIAAGFHACGPGLTYEFLRRQSGLKNPVKVFIGLDQFLRESGPAAAANTGPTSSTQS